MNSLQIAIKIYYYFKEEGRRRKGRRDEKWGGLRLLKLRMNEKASPEENLFWQV